MRGLKTADIDYGRLFSSGLTNMKRLLPDWTELAIFAALAVVCAGVVSLASARDLGLSLVSIPLFIACSIMGMRRSGQWGYLSSLDKTTPTTTTATEVASDE
jgi:hypothetical protein